MKVIHVSVKISLHLLTCKSSNHLGFRLGYPDQSKFQIQTILFNIKEWKKTHTKTQEQIESSNDSSAFLIYCEGCSGFLKHPINHFKYKSILTILKSSHQMWFKDILQQYLYKTSAHLRINRSF